MSKSTKMAPRQPLQSAAERADPFMGFDPDSAPPALPAETVDLARLATVLPGNAPAAPPEPVGPVGTKARAEARALGWIPRETERRPRKNSRLGRRDRPERTEHVSVRIRIEVAEMFRTLLDETQWSGPVLMENMIERYHREFFANDKDRTGT
jgi:hypothetical protein